MFKLAERYPSTVCLLVRMTAAYCGCLALYAMMRPGGAGLMALYFFFTVVFAVPVAICVTDFALGFTARSIAVRFAVTMATGILYGFFVVYMADHIHQKLLFAGPLVAAVASNFVFLDPRK